MKAWVWAWICGWLLAAPLAQAELLTSGNRGIRLFELYTSEGCSSCPPAEQWLSGLAVEPGLWRDTFVLAFHVSYWDYLGWRDPYGSKAFSARQYQHLNARHSRSVYTPQFFINSREWRGGELPEPASQSTGELRIDTRGSLIEASFTPLNAMAAPELHLALVAMGLTSQVTAGENRSRVLKHDFCVLQHQQVSGELGQGTWHFQAQWPALPTTAAGATRLARVYWIESGAEVQQALGHWLTRDAE
ncbi:DUF1223 domain-containing protein [Shewanella cyperi]|uniref:DUF1223 domain-containing protein n=1 Tax=Shewanella cyperi TaxID=2814292 RepID=UPI001A9492A0|nr:DUF1223 domain-containing protein [Shewanella cyperi]QSX40605.1 DUF1223 domain-containing protein [Shewanella cyperi]